MIQLRTEDRVNPPVSRINVFREPGHPKPDTVQRNRAVLTNDQFQMILPDHPFLQHRNPSTHKGRLRIAHPEGLQLFQFPEKGKLNVGKRNSRIHVQGGNLQPGIHQPLGDSPKPVSEISKNFLSDREARCHRMPAESHQVLVTFLQGLAHVETGHASDRPFPDTMLIERHHDRRTVIAFHQPRRDNADHATMPPFRAHHNRVRLVTGLHLRNRLLGYLFFNLSPLTVQLLQLLRKLKRLGFGIRGEQPDAQPGMGQSSGRIETRGHPKPDRAGRTRPVQAQVLGQRPNPASCPLSDLGQPIPYQDPVLIPERNQIGDGRQRHQVTKRLHRYVRGSILLRVGFHNLVGQATGT